MRKRKIVDLDDSQVSETARAVADALALEVFSRDNGEPCNACGCARLDDQGRSHYVLTVGLVMPQSIEDIEQVRCERCDLQCWPAEAE